MSWSEAQAQAQAAGLPEVFGILHRHLAGDQSLLRLAQAQLESAGMGAEVYPASVAQALADWQYVPRGLRRHIVHLPRTWDVCSANDRGLVLAFARSLAGRVRGLVLHDQPDWPRRTDALAAALADLDRQLATVEGEPMLFLEYAAGLTPDTYANIVQRLVHLPRVSACIDTGHVTAFVAKGWMTERHPRLQITSVDPADPGLGALAADLREAARRATEALVGLADRLASIGKPMHFHLHDGHLLSRLSRYGVSDHLPFGQTIPVGTALAGDGALPTMLGSEGLGRVLAAVRAHLSAADVSLTLELHPHLRLARKPLGSWASWFRHWTDLTNAELTHAWLDQVTEQAALVRRLWTAVR